MPSLACRICGRVVYTTAPLETLVAEERRCPRCGGMLYPDRRAANRRRPEPPGESASPMSLEPVAKNRRRSGRRRDDTTAL